MESRLIHRRLLRSFPDQAWEELVDEESGVRYWFNHVSSRLSFSPPTPEWRRILDSLAGSEAAVRGLYMAVGENSGE